MKTTRDYVAAIWLPLFALAVFGIFYLVWTLFDLPSKEEVISLAKVYFERYGMLTIFVSAIIEAMLFAGWYFPGSFVIVLGVIIAHDDPLQVFGVYAATTLGFWVAFAFNYYLGAYGWYRLFLALGLREPLERAQRQLTKYGPRAIFFTYWHPNLAALTSTAAGILQIPFYTFALYSVAASALYDAIWTVIGYSFGAYSLTLIGPTFVLPIIALWMGMSIVYRIRRERTPVAADATVESREQ